MLYTRYQYSVPICFTGKDIGALISNVGSGVAVASSGGGGGTAAGGEEAAKEEEKEEKKEESEEESDDDMGFGESELIFFPSWFLSGICLMLM